MACGFRGPCCTCPWLRAVHRQLKRHGTGADSLRMWNHVLRNREMLRAIASRTRPATDAGPDVRVIRRVRRDREAAQLVALSRRHLLGSN